MSRQLLRLIAFSSFIPLLAGCGDYFAQRDVDAMIERWVDGSDVEYIEMIDEIAACARFQEKDITEGSPLAQSLAGQDLIRSAGYEFRRTSMDDKHVAYKREDGRMHVRIAKRERPAESWFLFVDWQGG